jgi:hypothetical protein
MTRSPEVEAIFERLKHGAVWVARRCEPGAHGFHR